MVYCPVERILDWGRIAGLGKEGCTLVMARLTPVLLVEIPVEVDAGSKAELDARIQVEMNLLSRGEQVLINSLNTAQCVERQ